MNLQQSLNHYYQSLTHHAKNTIDPRLNSYFLDIHDLVMLIKTQLQTAIEQQLLPAIQFTIKGLKEDIMAFITITITGGLDNFPVYKPKIIQQWYKKGIPKQNGLIESAWYSEEFHCLEKILEFFIDRYNYTKDSQPLAAKRYWTMSEIDEHYEEYLMKKSISLI